MSGCIAADAPEDPPELRPNILLIVADDLGYSDLGIFGSEISTPNLDALAIESAVLTNFHTSPTCSPTRAMLLTGVDNHLAGMGNMKELATPAQRGHPGYEGHLNDRVVTVATLLRDAGYRTYLSGKWHLGDKPGLYPGDRGFSRTFALLHGAGNHYDNRGYSEMQPTVEYVEDGEAVSLPADFYSTTTFTDKIIGHIESTPADEPYFAYVAYTAPHWPLQAPADRIRQYEPLYADGWDRLRARRFSRLQELGLVPVDMELPPRWDRVPAWDALTTDEQQRAATVMATYAAMVTLMDQEVARLLAVVAERGELDNTLVIFMSDNGAEGRDLENFPHFDPWVSEHFPASATPGSADSFLFPGAGWGQVSVTPHDHHKQSTAEGGLRSSLMLRGPGITRRGYEDAFAQVTDVVPTLLDIADVTHPGTPYLDRPVVAPTGRSLRPLLTGAARTVYADDEPVVFELNDHVAVFRGPWKAVRLGPPFGNGEWALYRVEHDRAERYDLSREHPAILESLQADYRAYAREVGVVPRDPSANL